ncbi:cell division protein FtsQ/DivIB [Clostridium diolis]|nr:FtsQ-type POTRA domain-containing protein [Clostridium diolis]QES72808.1 FtsQ-type POTRA domain-containing protein [Clostridium diolis]
MVKTNNNKLILRSQRRRLIRKIIMTIIVLFIVGTIFAIKSNFFIIKKVSILGNPVMSGEDVKNGTENLIGQNILFINKQNIISNAKKNPYVENVEISKSYPKQVNIKISEKEGIYYVEKDGYKYVLDNDGNLLEKTDSVENRSLVNVKGIDLKDVALGQKMIDDSRVLDFLDIFYQIIKINPTNYKIDYVDISDFTNIKVYVGEVEGRLGNDENIPDKMNKLLHIIQNPDIGIVKGYVDVGFNGTPVYYKEER